MSRKFNTYSRATTREQRRISYGRLAPNEHGIIERITALPYTKSRFANSSDALGGSGDLIADQTLLNNLPAINPGELPTENTIREQGMTVNNANLAQLQSTHQNQARIFSTATVKNGGNGTSEMLNLQPRPS
jgi:hypothetical protein